MRYIELTNPILFQEIDAAISAQSNPELWTEQSQIHWLIGSKQIYVFSY